MAGQLVLVLVALIFEAHTQSCNSGSFPIMSISSLGLSPTIQVEPILECQSPKIPSNGCVRPPIVRNCPNSATEASSCLPVVPSIGQQGIQVGSSTSNIRGVLFPVPITETSCLSSSSSMATQPQCGFITPTKPSPAKPLSCSIPRTSAPCIPNIQPSSTVSSNPCKSSSIQSPTMIIDNSVASSLADSLQLLLLNDLIESSCDYQPLRAKSTTGTATTSQSMSTSTSSSTSSSAAATAASSVHSSNAIGSIASPISNPIILGLSNAPAVNLGGGQGNVAISKSSSASVSGTGPNYVEPCRGFVPNNCGGLNNLAITEASGQTNPYGINLSTCGCQNSLPSVNIEPCRSTTASCGNPNILVNSIATLGISDMCGPCNNKPSWTLNECYEWTPNTPGSAPQTVGITEVCKPVLQTLSVLEPRPCSCNAIQPNNGLFSSVVNPIASSLNELSDFLTTVAPLVDIASPMESNMCGSPEYIVPITPFTYAVPQPCPRRPQPCQSSTSSYSVSESSSIASSGSSSASSSSEAVSVKGNSVLSGTVPITPCTYTVPQACPRRPEPCQSSTSSYSASESSSIASSGSSITSSSSETVSVSGNSVPSGIVPITPCSYAVPQPCSRRPEPCQSSKSSFSVAESSSISSAGLSSASSSTEALSVSGNSMSSGIVPRTPCTCTVPLQRPLCDSSRPLPKPCSNSPIISQSSSTSYSATESSSVSSSGSSSSATSSSAAVSESINPASASISAAESVALTASNNGASLASSSTLAASAEESVSPSTTAAITSASTTTVATDSISSSKAESIAVTQDSPVIAPSPAIAQLSSAISNSVSSSVAVNSSPIVLSVPSNVFSSLPTSGYCSGLAGSVQPLVYELQIPASIPAQLQCSFAC